MSPSLDTLLSSPQAPTRRSLVACVLTLSLPAILSQLSTTLMQYIDAAMVGSLGAHATASIGLVEPVIWLFSGWATCAAAGFGVLVAQHVGASDTDRAQSVMCQAIVSCLAFGAVLALIGFCVSGHVSAWLGGSGELATDSGDYVRVCALGFLPLTMVHLGTQMLQCSGEVRTASIINVVSCVLDVLLNSFLIHAGPGLQVFGLDLAVPGLGLGVKGAALGTMLAETVTAVVLIYVSCRKSEVLRLSHPMAWMPQRQTIASALKVSAPMFLERTIMSCAYVAMARIVAPLGTTAIAANSLAITIEAVCYMPGMGVAVASTTLTGQAIGARRPELAKRFAFASLFTGMALLAASGTIMFVFAPQLMEMMTPDRQVIVLGSQILRIEAFCEPLFGASIVGAGALRGVADTLVPSLIVLVCMWCVRIGAASLVVASYGLVGVWVAMASELCLRGILFIVRMVGLDWEGREAIAS